MRALVPLGEKSSESVPERVLPYRQGDSFAHQYSASVLGMVYAMPTKSV